MEHLSAALERWAHATEPRSGGWEEKACVNTAKKIWEWGLGREKKPMPLQIADKRDFDFGKAETPMVLHIVPEHDK